jgi:plasmid stabilization system protein ParE
MSWRVVIRPEAEEDMVEAAAWYEERHSGLGAEFVHEVIQVWDALAENPLLNSRRHSRKDIRWRYPERFPYRIIYEVIELDKTVVVAAVLHAARRDRHGQAAYVKLGR